MKNFKFIIITFFFLLITFSCLDAECANIPKAVIECAKQHYRQKELRTIFYVMRWNKYKIYEVKYNEYGVIWNNHHNFILYDGKTAHRPNAQEYSNLSTTSYAKAMNKKRYDNYKKLGRKLYWHRNKVMKAIDETQSPGIPSVIEKYADKYMFKQEGRKIVYLMEWNGQHVYRVYWPEYVNHPYSIVLYNEQEIRRPTKYEYRAMRSALSDAMLKYAMEQECLHNKD